MEGSCAAVSSCNKYSLESSGSSFQITAFQLRPLRLRRDTGEPGDVGCCQMSGTDARPDPRRRKRLILMGGCTRSSVPPHWQAVPDPYRRGDRGSLQECLLGTSASHQAAAAGREKQMHRL